MKVEYHCELITKQDQYPCTNPPIINESSFFSGFCLTIYEHSKPLLWIDIDQEIPATLSIFQQNSDHFNFHETMCEC